MCLLALALHQHPRFPVVLAANRDEFHQRPTAPMRWWASDGRPERILGGRDLAAGGHWLAVGAHGRVAALTNIREPAAAPASARSRGEIVQHWVAHPATPSPDASTANADGVPAQSAETYAQWLQTEPFQGFNLLAGELGRDEPSDRWWHLRRGRATARPLGRGVHGLSNGDLDTPWPKLVRLRQATQATLQGALGASEADVNRLAEQLFALLRDETRPDDRELPDTGIGLARERELGSVFIRAPHWGYGTRCSTVLVVVADDAGQRSGWVWERSWDAAGRLGGDVRAPLPQSLFTRP